MDYFDDKDCFVVNNTKVFPARMYGRKEKTGAKIEVFLLRELNKANRDGGTYGNKDGKDMSHTKSGKLVLEAAKSNRARNGKNKKSTKK